MTDAQDELRDLLNEDPTEAFRAHLRDMEFEAFKAGFEFSGEGHNGEYVHESYRGDAFEAMLIRGFEHWKRTGSFEAPDD